ncbi:hypothetical protein [Halochromatium glycolicum]|uniref:Uncharacterized protein n=1 Tax=Halochromatium glycolicum TaxID=85075 RepID=A0AAJ0U4D3_9GAMM|nr:hypothetical protein [Halochromatium glycolicum]MBK1705016.1 hypothetical protein [Halochromatium glycolicum]
MAAEPWRGAARTILLAVSVAGLFPPVAALFEASMRSHLLVQMPLLAFCGGYWVYRSPPLKRWLERVDPSGYIALVVGSGWFIYWMLPISLDLATFDPGIRLLKIVTVPVCVGAALTWSWLRLGPIGRGVMLLEGWAILGRLGWVYLISPVQLCSNYLIDDQQRTGSLLLGAALISAVGIALWAVFGPFRKPHRTEQE